MSGAAPKQTAPSTYTMREVVRATGLSEHTLRAWERRHGAVEPHRTDGGTRLYSPADRERLGLLKRLGDEGARIGAVAALSLDELYQRVAERRGATPEPRRATPRARARAAGLRFDAAETQAQLAGLLADRGPTAFAREVALPMLAKLGDLWHRGDIGPAPEHLVTSIVRSLIGSGVRTRERGPSTPTFLFATLQGEEHELGLLAAALIANEAGARVVYLGPDLPSSEIAHAASEAGAQVVVLAMTAQPEIVSGPLVGELGAELPPRTQLWLGGVGAAAPDGVEARILKSFDDFERHLRIAVHPGPTPVP